MDREQKAEDQGWDDDLQCMDHKRASNQREFDHVSYQGLEQFDKVYVPEGLVMHDGASDEVIHPLCPPTSHLARLVEQKAFPGIDEPTLEHLG